MQAGDVARFAGLRVVEGQLGEVDAVRAVDLDVDESGGEQVAVEVDGSGGEEVGGVEVRLGRDDAAGRGGDVEVRSGALHGGRSTRTEGTG